MTKRLVDIDDAELRQAQTVGNYATIKQTVSAGLRELAAAEARRREIVWLTAGSMSEFADGPLRADAWR
jgi:hypothetical protein